MSVIIAAAREVDGKGSLASLHEQWRELQLCGARLTELVIDPLAAGWDTPLSPNHFRSGCAPLEALAYADQLLRAGDADAVLIRGEDNLRSDYANGKSERARQMAIYDECSIPQAYTLLAREFMRLHDLSDGDFGQLADTLFENYLRTAQRDDDFQLPARHADTMITELFRKRDCANPNVDFAGAIIVAPTPAIARDDFTAIEIRAIGLAQSSGDGPAHVEEIARYDHLRTACEATAASANLDFARAFRDGDALLEAYTCFPVAPLGFLLSSGIVSDVAQIPSLLQTHEITVTGGMNLARAPWNNPALNALIVMCNRLAVGAEKLGIVHGNGGLGYRQGVAILQC
ncbi:MAG: hypothetical protein ABI210_15515 [Abditibacteriaceae bacterium]